MGEGAQGLDGAVGEHFRGQVTGGVALLWERNTRAALRRQADGTALAQRCRG